MRIFWNRITLQARLVCLGLVVNVTLIGLLASLALWAAQTLVRDSLTERDIEVRALLTMAALADQGGSSNREQPSWSGILEQAGGLSYLQWLDRNGKVRVQTGRTGPERDLDEQLPENLWAFLAQGPVWHRQLALPQSTGGIVRYGMDISPLQQTVRHMLWLGGLVLLLAVSGVWGLQQLLLRWVGRPLRRLLAAARRFEEGDRHVSLPAAPTREFQALYRSFENMRDRVSEQLESLHRQQETLYAIADHTYAWELWVAPDGSITWVNPSIYRITGFAVSDCLGPSAAFLNLVHAQDRARVAHGLQVSLNDRQPGQGFEFRVRHASGSTVWVVASWTPIYSPDSRYLGLRLSLLDCTEARSTREALKQAVSHLRNAQDEVEQHLHHTRKEQARLDTLLASLHLGLVFVDAEWRVLYANPLFSQLWFLPPAEQIKGCPLSGLLPALAGNGPEEGAAESEYKLEDGRIVLVRQAAIQGGENCQDNGFLLLCEDVTAARASAEQLVFLAERDTLTGVFNRRRFQVEIDRMWRLAERRQRRMGLLAFDLNDFKLINDNHGHAAGDEVLIEIARAVSRTVRQDELFCRLGGDEFAVLLPEADVYDSTRLAMRIESCVSALQFEFDGVARRVSASIGIAVAPDHANCADALSAAADAAMYQAKKENPQGCWRVFDPGLHVIGMSRWGMGNASAQDGRLEPTVIVDGSSAAAHDTDQLFAACQREADSLA